jgi:hypothetical protein
VDGEGLLRKTAIRFIIGMVGYAIVLSVSIFILARAQLPTPLAVVIALLPVLPFLLVMAAVIGGVRQQDELQRRIHLEAVVIAALVTGAITFSYGLLEVSGLVPHLTFVWVAPLMIALWGVAAAIISRHYQ